MRQKFRYIFDLKKKEKISHKKNVSRNNSDESSVNNLNSSN
jgi:hypothetical protein